MLIKTAEFLMSNSDYKKCPEAQLNEFAFIGRSNVGKSSLINMLTNHKKLAKISSSPGKTQLINHFLINKEWYLVDLPGYGFAKVPKTMRAKFTKMINAYITNRENLVCMFVLIDSRIPAQENDLKFINWLGENAIPFCIVFTKADKLGTEALKKNIAKYKEVLLETWENLPVSFISSAVKGKGKDEILDYIANLNKTINAEDFGI